MGSGDGPSQKCLIKREWIKTKAFFHSVPLLLYCFHWQFSTSSSAIFSKVSLDLFGLSLNWHTNNEEQIAKVFKYTWTNSNLMKMMVIFPDKGHKYTWTNQNLMTIKLFFSQNFSLYAQYVHICTSVLYTIRILYLIC